MGRTASLFLIFSLWLSLVTIGQEKNIQLPIDSLQEKPLKYLSDNFYSNEEDSAKALVYAVAYLDRSRKLEDSLKIANGFYFLSSISSGENSLHWNDSILTYTRNKQNAFFPSMAYVAKGNYYYQTRNFYEALHSYLNGLESVGRNKNEDLKNYIKNRIALLKSRYGQDEEALDLFKEVYEYYAEKENLKNSKELYFPIVFALADSYLRNGKKDSASYYVRKGYRESLQYPVYRNYFIFEQGLIEYSLENYSAAADSLKNSLPLLIQDKDLPNIAYANYFLGKSYHQLDKHQEAIKHFEKVDSLYQILKDIHPDLRDTYVHLIDYYKSKEDKTHQLLYISKLLEVDSVFHENYKIINEKFINAYDTPKLIREKERLIDQLRQNITDYSTWNYVLLIMAIVSAVVAAGFHYKRRKDVQRFNAILSEIKKPQEDPELPNEETEKVPAGIGKEITENILTRISDFEREKGYLKKKLKLSDLAIQFGTNSKYLSMVINQSKNKNFSQYINDLRIEYVLNRLQQDAKFRKYTIKAISEEAGFNNPESFSKAFHNRARIYPSFFISQLERSEETSWETGLNS